jgi:hypothetical protein
MSARERASNVKRDVSVPADQAPRRPTSWRSQHSPTSVADDLKRVTDDKEQELEALKMR